METSKIELHASNCTALGIIGKMRVAIELHFWHLHVPVKWLLLVIFYDQLHVIYENQLVTKTSLVCLRLSFLLVTRCLFLFARCSLLFARQEILNNFLELKKKKVFMGICPTISHTCYLYLSSRLSLFMYLVLLKEIKSRNECKI